MASSSDDAKVRLTAAAENLHERLALELRKKAEVKPGVHMELVKSLHTLGHLLSKDPRTQDVESFNFACQAIYGPVCDFAGCSIEQVKLGEELFIKVARLVRERKELVNDYLQENRAGQKNGRERKKIFKELDALLNQRFPSGIFVTPPDSR
jgi:hypothetical protein